MATVTGYTAARMKAIEDNAIVGGTVTNGNLILSRNNGQTINAGSVVGPAGPAVATVTSTTRPSSPTEPNLIYESDTDRFLFWDGSKWTVISGRLPHCRLTRTSASAALAAGFANVPFTTVARDNFSGADLANNRIVVPSGFPTGLWILNAQINFTAAAATTARAVIVNSAQTSARVVSIDIPSIGGGAIPISKVVRLSPGQDVYLTSYSASGTVVADGNANEDTTSLSLTWLGPSA